MSTTSNPVLIEKEDIEVVHFIKTSTSINPSEFVALLNDLNKAVILGNSQNHVKVKITFDTTDGLRMVNTTIWQADDKGITLKGGVMIPVHSIVKVAIL